MGGSNRALKVGVQLPEVEYEARWSEIRDMAHAADDLGYDSVWVGDHLLYDAPALGIRGPWEAWTQLAAIAAVTERVQLGPLVACTAFHPPPMLAKLAVTVDEVSGGRLILGLGAGWNEREFRAYGLPFEARVARFEEAFTIIRTLLREGEIDFVGRFYEARECVLVPRGPRPGAIPLMVGSVGPRMLRATLPHVEQWNVWWQDHGNTPQGIGPLRQTVDSIAHEVGRNPAHIERTVAIYVRLPGGAGRKQGSSAASRIEPLAGPPESLAESLLAFAREGISHVQVVMDPITRASIEQFAPVLRLVEDA